MVKELFKRSYRQAETVNSMIKRDLGSALCVVAANASRQWDLRPKVMTRDLTILRPRAETEHLRHLWYSRHLRGPRTI